MKILRIILPAILLMTLLSGSAFAQTKVATVNLEKLLKGFWKVQRGQALLHERFTKDQNDDKDTVARLKKMDDEYEQLLEQANDQAISSDERAKRKQTADAELKELQSEKVNAEQIERQEMAALDDQGQRMVENSLEIIKAAVAGKAKAGGYSVVLDTSTRTINAGGSSIELPSEVVYSNGDDLTDAVLAQINAGAPIDAAAPTMANPVPSLTGTNSP
jgi:outer membrane protein